MCVAVPLQVLALRGHRATVGMSGVIMTADISFIDKVNVGDYLLIHAGIAIARWLPEQAEELLDLLGLIEDIHE